MAAVGSSRPASGCEHHASHFWDLLAGRGVRPRALHGLQVGYATGFAMRLQRFAFGGGVTLPRRPEPVAEPLDAAARAWLGEPPPDVLAAVAEKQRLIASVPASWPDDEARWAALRARLGAVARELRRGRRMRCGAPASRIGGRATWGSTRRCCGPDCATAVGCARATRWSTSSRARACSMRRSTAAL